jgi:hypothetical protein
VDDPEHRPAKPEEKPLPRGRLVVRLYEEPCLYELARWVSYGGRRHEQVREFLAGHRRKYGDKATWALHQLTTTDSGSNLTVLRPEARRACRVLLGPAPESEEYPAYWERQGRPPPPEHLPPPPENEPPGQAPGPGR